MISTTIAPLSAHQPSSNHILILPDHSRPSYSSSYNSTNCTSLSSMYLVQSNHDLRRRTSYHTLYAFNNQANQLQWTHIDNENAARTPLLAGNVCLLPLDKDHNIPDDVRFEHNGTTKKFIRNMDISALSTGKRGRHSRRVEVIESAWKQPRLVPNDITVLGARPINRPRIYEEAEVDAPKMRKKVQLAMVMTDDSGDYQFIYRPDNV